MLARISEQTLKPLRHGLRGSGRGSRAGDGESLVLDDLIEAWKHALERLRLVRDPELEKCLLLHDLPGAPRILNPRNLHDDAVVPLLLHDRLGDADAFDPVADRLECPIDGLGNLVRGNRLLRLVDLERQVRTALEVQPLSQWHSTLDDVAEHAIGPALTNLDVTRKEGPDRQDA